MSFQSPVSLALTADVNPLNNWDTYIRARVNNAKRRSETSRFAYSFGNNSVVIIETNYGSKTMSKSNEDISNFTIHFLRDGDKTKHLSFILFEADYIIVDDLHFIENACYHILEILKAFCAAKNPLKELIKTLNTEGVLINSKYLSPILLRKERVLDIKIFQQ